jgi:hypothetical protein
MTFGFLLVVLSVWLPGFALWRFVKRAKDPDRKEVSPIRKRRDILPLVPFSGGVFLALGIFRGARIFLLGTLLKSTYVLASSLLLTVILDLLSDYLYPRKPGGRDSGRKIVSCFLMGLCGVSVFLFVSMLQSMPGSKRDALKMSVPFQGKWRVITGGRFKFMNYHHGNPTSQNFAADFVRMEGGEGASRGRKVYSPVSGTVVKSVGDLKEGNLDPPEGNIVIIKTDEGVHVWLCHLQEGSVKVSSGERIEVGREIAACGASGGADVPHLHLHAEKDGKPVPMLLGKSRIFPIRGDVISK